jgi:eukaryotic-like serine/threonine-protein kinase
MTSLLAIFWDAIALVCLCVEEANKLIQIDPDSPIGYSLLAFNDRNLGRLNEAQTTLRRAEERRFEIPDLSEERFYLAFLEHDPSAMQREARRAQQNSEGEDLIYYYQGCAAAYTGHLREARTLSHRAEELAKQSSHKERAALFETGSSLWEAPFGEMPAARDDAVAAFESSKDREVLYGAALALSLSGDYSRSKTMTDDLDSRFTDDTSVRFS